MYNIIQQLKSKYIIGMKGVGSPSINAYFVCRSEYVYWKKKQFNRKLTIKISLRLWIILQGV